MPRTPPLSPRHLAMLREHDTPTVLNVIELFDARPRHAGYCDGSIRAVYPHLPPVVGYASTATFASARPAASGDAYSSLVEHARRLDEELPEPRVVVFQDVDPTPTGATFGEVMCTVYKAWGCVGLVTSGGARDVEQVGRLGFPCWAASVIPSHAWCRIVDVHVPVTVGGCDIAPGALLHADANGVAVIPDEIAREVAIGCGLLVEAEQSVLRHAAARIQTPALGRDIDGLRAAYSRSKELFATIPQRARAILASE